MFPALKELEDIQKNKAGYSELLAFRAREKKQGYKIVQIRKIAV